MRKLQLTPEARGYSAQVGGGALSVTLDGPAGRHRTDVSGDPVFLNLNWQLEAEEYRYLRAFYRTGTRRGAEPFLLDLVVSGPEVLEHTVKFVDGSFVLTEVSGETFRVTATVEARPSANVITAELLMALEQLVNFDLPGALGEVA